jgi:hypothetical protein
MSDPEVAALAERSAAFVRAVDQVSNELQTAAAADDKAEIIRGIAKLKKLCGERTHTLSVPNRAQAG